MPQNLVLIHEPQVSHDRAHDFQPIKSILPRTLDHLMSQWEHLSGLRRTLEAELATPFSPARSQALDEAIVREEAIISAIANQFSEENGEPWMG